MSRADLHVVAAGGAEIAPTETVAERIRRLQAEVRTLSAQQVSDLCDQVRTSMSFAGEVAANPSQPEGVRQLAQQMVRDGESLLLTLQQIIARTA
jgi:hypothetical protein